MVMRRGGTKGPSQGGVKSRDETRGVRKSRVRLSVTGVKVYFGFLDGKT